MLYPEKPLRVSSSTLKFLFRRLPYHKTHDCRNSGFVGANVLHMEYAPPMPITNVYKHMALMKT